MHNIFTFVGSRLAYYGRTIVIEDDSRISSRNVALLADLSNSLVALSVLEFLLVHPRGLLFG